MKIPNVYYLNTKCKMYDPFRHFLVDKYQLIIFCYKMSNNMSLKHFFQQSINKCGREDRKRTGPDFNGFSDQPTTQPEVSLVPVFSDKQFSSSPPQGGAGREERGPCYKRDLKVVSPQV